VGKLSDGKWAELGPPGMTNNSQNKGMKAPGGSQPSSDSSSGGGSLTENKRNNTSNGQFDINVWLHVAMFSWALFTVVFTWALVVCWVVRWLALAHVASFIYFDQRWGGFELFQAWIAGAVSAKKEVKKE